MCMLCVSLEVFTVYETISPCSLAQLGGPAGVQYQLLGAGWALRDDVWSVQALAAILRANERLQAHDGDVRETARGLQEGGGH